MTIMNPYLLLLAHNITSYDLISTTQANKYRTYKETLSGYCHESDQSQIRILQHTTLVRTEQTLFRVRLLSSQQVTEEDDIKMEGCMSSLVKYLLFATNFLIFVSSTSNGYKLTWNMTSACVTCFPIEVLPEALRHVLEAVCTRHDKQKSLFLF